tara:strand:+ start:868 stop:1512 length:645 start_codon:yes stop_codon:yes gene_type:complete
LLSIPQKAGGGVNFDPVHKDPSGSFFYPHNDMQWLVFEKMLVARIYCDFLHDQPFEQLKEYAYAALDTPVPLGDDQRVSIKEEYQMQIPPKFEQWLAHIIHKTYSKHKPVNGILGITEDNIKISGMWVNRMHKGEQHQVHQHGGSFYSFSAYIECTDNDAPFYFIDNNQGQPVYINKESEQHILIFPSDLIHTVHRKTTDAPRISVSGNVILNT